MAEGRRSGVGRRIQELRLLRGHTLRELGRRAAVSASMLSRIETGARTPSEQVLAALARALGVTVSVLHGQPYIEQLRKDQLDRLISPLGTALDNWGIPPEDDDPAPRGLEQLGSDISRVRQLRTDSEYGTLAEMLPGLLGEMSHATMVHSAPGHDRERAHWLQAEAALGVFSVAYKFGYMDLARLALSRMAMAAALSGDPRQVAAERVKRAQLSADGPAMEQGLRLVRQGLRDLEDDGTPGTRAVRGGLILKGVQMHGLLGRGDEAGAWLAEARGIAAELGETNHYLFVFGPTNTEQHAMAAAGDRDDHAEAVAVSDRVRLPAGYPAARAGVYWIDRARSLALTARCDGALDALYEARKVSPQQTRYHPTTHSTVGVLLRARPSVPDRLRSFAGWSGT
ncbi:helix-turn-helix domain-containing protein [Streptomyces uncialis]|uniref:XRE family transcriptional regulator n=1 Tax=Streptomyces uncialis TaxID=1048205 RepID=A0A1Q4VDF6_9ACTN|nr:helix-turn-helix transcriptional regulator [Streptomyces uncialis]OKH95871.1 XRE family transcriptional regulator [Streptomyces uncialis]